MTHFNFFCVTSFLGRPRERARARIVSINQSYGRALGAQSMMQLFLDFWVQAQLTFTGKARMPNLVVYAHTKFNRLEKRLERA